jgi:hypothetical protein
MAYRPVAAIVRFYQGEWLARLPHRTGWRHLFAGGVTPVAKPRRRDPFRIQAFAAAVWTNCGPTCQRFVDTCRRRATAGHTLAARRESWPAQDRVLQHGDSVTLRESTPRPKWLRTWLDVLASPQ